MRLERGEGEKHEREWKGIRRRKGFSERERVGRTERRRDGGRLSRRSSIQVPLAEPRN